MTRGKYNNRFDLILNWWRKDTDAIPREHIDQLDVNARRRIDTILSKDEKTMSGTLEFHIHNTKYECLWYLKKRKNILENRI